jgi:tRNA A37 threonylcarbamoyladenosine dehydratase
MEPLSRERVRDLALGIAAGLGAAAALWLALAPRRPPALAPPVPAPQAAPSRRDSPELLAEQLSRTAAFFGAEAHARGVESAHVVVVGVGGVGSHAAMALGRSGVRSLRVVDFDNVTLSSLNRHASAAREDVGTPKVLALRRALARIAPSCAVDAQQELFALESAERLLEGGGRPDFVLDCIDDRDTKAALLVFCRQRGLRVISSLGAGGKADPTRLLIGDLSLVRRDPLGTAVRHQLRRTGELPRATEDGREIVRAFKRSAAAAVVDVAGTSGASTSAGNGSGEDACGGGGGGGGGGSGSGGGGGGGSGGGGASAAAGGTQQAEASAAPATRRSRKRERAAKGRLDSAAILAVNGAAATDGTVGDASADASVAARADDAADAGLEAGGKDASCGADAGAGSGGASAATAAAAAKAVPLHDAATEDAAEEAAAALLMTGIPCVYSSEPARVKLLPLLFDASAGEAPADFGALQGFRVRVLPVLGTMPAVFGQAMASFVLCELAGAPLAPAEAIPLPLSR